MTDPVKLEAAAKDIANCPVKTDRAACLVPTDFLLNLCAALEAEPAQDRDPENNAADCGCYTVKGVGLVMCPAHERGAEPAQDCGTCLNTREVEAPVPWSSGTMKPCPDCTQDSTTARQKAVSYIMSAVDGLLWAPNLSERQVEYTRVEHDVADAIAKAHAAGRAERDMEVRQAVSTAVTRHEQAAIRYFDSAQAPLAEQHELAADALGDVLSKLPEAGQ